MNQEIIAIFTQDGFTIDTIKTQIKAPFIDAEILKNFQNNPQLALFNFSFLTTEQVMHPSIRFLHTLSQFFIDHLTQDATIELTRLAPEITVDDILPLLNQTPFAIGAEFITDDWVFARMEEFINTFNQLIAEYPGTVASFLQEKNENLETVGRVYFHLVESKDEEFPFAFLATYASLKTGEVKANHLPLRHALAEFEDDQEKLLQMLASVTKVADASNFISGFMESGELFSPLKITTREAYTFLKEVPLYEASGVKCRIPNWWKQKSATPKLSVAVGTHPPVGVGMEAILNFSPELLLDGEKITRAEIEALLTETSGLAWLKGKWIEVDHEKLQALLKAYDEAGGSDELTLADMIATQMNMKQLIENNDDIEIEVTTGEWLKDLRHRMLSPREIESLELGDEFKATLRHYQQEGFDWLRLMNNIGFGALLADDMGLGKTVQILALLEHKRQTENHKTLLIVPTSLLGNWEKEIAKFAPKLTYKILHSSKEDITIDKADGIDLIITTYGMAVRLEQLQNFKWNLVILDEAQAIKNPGTKQTKTIKKIPATSRIAMTGTPIENKLGDLWSLFDFLNTGMLGSAKEFTQYAKKITTDGDYSRLKETVNPFILRRLKTDKSIINDLPDKVEENAYTTLSKKQIMHYEKLVKSLQKSLEETDGIQKKGIVLASIMKLKQICNHPDQYLGQENFTPADSGKFERLTEICETIKEKRERVLIFTQFKEMTEPLARHLEGIFGRKGLVLHGGTSAKKRAEMVDAYQSEKYIPFMVLSLKAGGVGLNLTNANHVIHFDRWWNPAIENQATDRAFRIGQQKNVMVHKFVTKGTIEEKIDAMIAEKQKLSGDIIAKSGENWITELDNDQLMSLFTLEGGI